MRPGRDPPVARAVVESEVHDLLGLRGAAVEIERRLDGSHWLRYRGRYLHLHPCPEPPRLSASPSGLRPPGLAEQIPKPKDKNKPKYHVPAEHPWRKSWKRTFLSCAKPDISTCVDRRTNRNLLFDFKRVFNNTPPSSFLSLGKLFIYSVRSEFPPNTAQITHVATFFFDYFSLPRTF
jgi:hypothetical protein